jgi:hypothetical protein
LLEDPRRVNQPVAGLDLHRAALAHFHAVADGAGVAETVDLVGLANLIAGNRQQSIEYLERAVEAFGAVGNYAGTSSALATPGGRALLGARK